MCDYAHVFDVSYSQNTCSVPTRNEGTLSHATLTQTCHGHMVATISNATNGRARDALLRLLGNPSNEISARIVRTSFEIWVILDEIWKERVITGECRALERSVHGLRLTPDVGRRIDHKDVSYGENTRDHKVSFRVFQGLIFIVQCAPQ